MIVRLQTCAKRAPLPAFLKLIDPKQNDLNFRTSLAPIYSQRRSHCGKDLGSGSH
jgi:hypothetical protein